MELQITMQAQHTFFSELKTSQVLKKKKKIDVGIQKSNLDFIFTDTCNGLITCLSC